MRICSYKGLVMVVMLRDEHCPPHAHVDGGRWSALLGLVGAPDRVEIEL
jgi:hypothetical protein